MKLLGLGGTLKIKGETCEVVWIAREGVTLKNKSGVTTVLSLSEAEKLC